MAKTTTSKKKLKKSSKKPNIVADKINKNTRNKKVNVKTKKTLYKKSLNKHSPRLKKFLNSFIPIAIATFTIVFLIIKGVGQTYDLEVTGISTSPNIIKQGQSVIFSAVIKNSGSRPTPDHRIIKVLFLIDGHPTSWSNSYDGSLAAGQSINLQANDGQAGKNSWAAEKGSHNVKAIVDDNNLFNYELSETNNSFSFVVNVAPSDNDALIGDIITQKQRCKSEVWSNLEACNWTGAVNSGVPLNTVLTHIDPPNGILDVASDNAVIDSADIAGQVRVTANNVTIKRSRISLNDSSNDSLKLLDNSVVVIGSSDNLKSNITFEDCEISGSNLAIRALLVKLGSSITIRRCNLHNISTAIESQGSSVTAENNWIHDLNDLSSNNPTNGILITAGKKIIIRHNSILNDSLSAQSSISLISTVNNIEGVMVVNNLISGGVYAFYDQQTAPFLLTNSRFVNNSISRHIGAYGGKMGVFYPGDKPADLIVNNNLLIEDNAKGDNCSVGISALKC